jgi:Zn-dependent protease with chaperone function
MPHAAGTILLSVGLFIIFAALCQSTFGRLRRALALGAAQSAVTIRYHRAQTHLSILALGNMVLYAYVLNIKSLLQWIPSFNESLTLPGMVGLGIFLIHLETIWFFCHPVYQDIYRSGISRSGFMKGHFAFSSAILIPWLLISLLSDLLQMLEVPFLRTNFGEFFSLGLLLVVFILAAPGLIVRLWGCKPIPDDELRQTLELFCKGHGFRTGGFLLWPLMSGEMLTAGIIGILPRLRYILITRGLLNLLNLDELKSVVAHEMGHVRRYHLIMYLIFFLCFSALTYSFHDPLVLFILKNERIFSWIFRGESMDMNLFSLLYGLPILMLLILYFRFVFGFFLRNSERQADLYAMQLIGHPFSLISSFQKIAFFSGQSEDVPSWHHYSIRERMNFLLRAHRNEELVRRHHQKLYGAAILFFSAVTGLIILSQNLNETDLMSRWRTDIQVSALERELKSKHDNPELYAGYGGLLMERGQFAEAGSILQKGLQLAPDNVSLLNTLAWLYATSPAPHANAEEALRLAQNAAAIQADPHVLDTLAEAYYVNGRYPEALNAIERALEKGPENEQYYLKQKEKFQKALRQNQKGGAGRIGG